jgi:hypothetical protein
VASFDGWGQAGVYIGDTRFCVAPSKENAERIAAALNSVEGIATQSNAQAGVVPEGMMLVPIDPPFPKKWIAKGVRTENEKQSVVWLGYTDEGGGWHQWCTHKNSAKLFDTEEAAIRNAKSCTGPWYNEPAKSSITAEQVEGPQAHKYRAALAAVKEKDRG